MRLLSFALVLSTALLASIRSHAQNYRPFGPGRTYHYQEATQWAGVPDQLHLFRVERVTGSGGDSVFYFNGNFRGTPPLAVTLFGEHFRWNGQTGEAVFRGYDIYQTGAPTADSVRLLTRAAVGQSWAFTSQIQATLTARQVQLVAGRPDSVLLISLSDTQQIQLSQHYGIISGPGLHYYLGAHCFAIYQPPRSASWNKQRHVVRLISIPELNLGPFDLRLASLYDVQPGDIFFYRKSYQGGFSCSEAKTRRQVARVRRLAGVARTVYFHTTEATITGNSPVGCSWPPGAGSVTFSQANDSLRLFWTEELLTGDNGVFWLNHFYPGTYDSMAVGGRPQVEYSVMSPGPGTYPEYFRFAPGLGQTAYIDANSSSCCHHIRSEWMVGFIKGTEVWGDTTMPRLLAVPNDVRQLPATLAPNPSATTEAPLLTFSTDQSQTATLTLYDDLGRDIWRQQVPLAGGEQRLAVGTLELPPGLYRLRLTLADGRQRVLPLVRE